MWNWTKMGARVFVTPGEIMTPVKISHQLLATMKVVPQPVAVDEPPANKPLAVKADKSAPEAKPANSEASLELRSSVGHIEAVKPVATEATDSTSRRDQTHTADASGDTRVPKSPATMSDASAGSKAPPRDEVAAKREETVAVDNKPADAKPAETTTSETKAAETAVADTAAKKPEEAAAASTVTNDTPKVEAKPDQQAAVGVKPEEKAEQKAEEEPAETKIEAAKVEPEAAKPELAKPELAKPELAQSEAAKAEPAKTEAAKSEVKPSEAKSEDKIKSDDKARPAAVAADASKDQSRLAGKPAVAKPELPKRTGQIAVFVSRKDSKLYVRQNFSPLFEMPITIAASDRPLGTHVFTAETDKNDANVLRWSVVSLPMSAKALQRSADEERVSHRRNKVAAAGPIEMKPLPLPDSAAEALDRITIPPDAMARITEALSTGGSIIVSDQGINQGETGEGTDFIVSLR
jgi:hypothetical protein